MAFTVGVNSFVSVADADAYFLDRGNATWAAISTDAEKEDALVRGTDYLVQKYTGCWVGSITSTSQDLPWPRIGVVTSDGIIISSGSIPTAIENATSEMALRANSNPNLLADTGAGAENIKSDKVDVLKTEFFQGASTQNTYTIVSGILKDYVIAKGNALRITRGCDLNPYGYWGFETLRS